MTTDQLIEHDPACGSYLPGHDLHWSLYKKTSSARMLVVSQVIVRGTSLELVVPGQPSLHWLHHAPGRLEAAVERSVEPILACPDWRTLRVDGYWFNCAPEGVQLSVCS